MPEKIKIFTTNNAGAMENLVNIFIRDLYEQNYKVLDIKFNSVYTGDNIMYYNTLIRYI